VQKEFGFSIIEMMEFASQKSCLEIEGWAGHRAVMFVPKHPASWNKGITQPYSISEHNHSWGNFSSLMHCFTWSSMQIFYPSLWSCKEICHVQAHNFLNSFSVSIHFFCDLFTANNKLLKAINFFTCVPIYLCILKLSNDFTSNKMYT
jgi:hypothetical protein